MVDLANIARHPSVTLGPGESEQCPILPCPSSQRLWPGSAIARLVAQSGACVVKPCRSLQEIDCYFVRLTKANCRGTASRSGTTCPRRRTHRMKLSGTTVLFGLSSGNSPLFGSISPARLAVGHQKIYHITTARYLNQLAVKPAVRGC